MSIEENKKSVKQEGYSYDKIFKENAVEIFRPLIEEELGILIISFEAEEHQQRAKMTWRNI